MKSSSIEYRVHAPRRGTGADGKPQRSAPPARTRPRAPVFRVAVAGFLFASASLSGCAITPRNAAITGFVSCQVVDVWQTKWALDNGYTEMNPALGSDPSTSELIAAKALSAAAGALIYQLLPERWKTSGMVVATAPCAAAVAHNYSVGVRP